MARRRRKGGVSKLAFVAIVAIVGIGIVVALSAGVLDLSSLGIEFDTQNVQDAYSGWTFGDELVRFALTAPNTNIDCASSTLTRLTSTSGQTVVFSRSAIKALPVTTFFSVVPIDSTVPISKIEVSTATVCIPLFGTAEVVTGTVKYTWQTIDANNNIKTIKTTSKGILAKPSATTLIVSIPKDSVTASQIESAVGGLGTLSSKFVPVTVHTDLTLVFRTSATGSLTNTGKIMISTGASVKILNESVPPPPSTQRIPNISSITPSEFDYIGSLTPTTVKTNQISSGEKINIRVIGNVENYKSGDPLPRVDIFDPTGQISEGNVVMQRLGSIGSTKTSFNTGTFEVSRITFRDSNISTFDGIWFAKMKMTVSGQGTLTDTKTFAVNDARNTVPTTLNCTLPLVPNSSGTACVDPPTTITCISPKIPNSSNTACVDPPTITCPSGKIPDVTGTICIDKPVCKSVIDLQIEFRDATLQEIQSVYNVLKPKADAGTLDQCETNSWIIVQAEFDRRGIDPEEGTGIVPPTGTSPVSFISYENFFTDIEGIGTCPNQKGQVPQEGLPIIGFQLFGVTCEGFKLGSIQLTPTLDFGDRVKEITIQDVTFRQEIFLAKNNPFPSKPTIGCTGSTSSNIGTCAITNYVIANSGIPAVSLTPDESATLKRFIDRETRGEYQILEVIIKESSLLNKVKAKGIGLSEGDELSLMYLIWGKIRGTDNSVAFFRDFQPMTYVQNFEFVDPTDAPCLSPSMLDENGQCQAPDPPDKPDCQVPPNTLILGICIPPDDPICPSGTSPPDFSPYNLEDCVTTVCQANEEVPICLADEVHDISTTEKDHCGDFKIVCIKDPNLDPPIIPPTPPDNTCPNEDEFRDKFDVCVKVNPDDMCPDDERRNSQNECEKITIPPPPPPEGTQCKDGETLNKETMQCERDFCKLDASFNLLQCFASLFGSGTAPPAQIGGIPLGTLIIVVAVGTIAIAVVTVVVRRRSGGGISV
ncbi:MAG: hypothetical protein KJI69_04025 [Patescibacteria group bacterium]|nr:hypothetical protein [Patescibacteria group bacterium]